jgi:hypothetical protein
MTGSSTYYAEPYGETTPREVDCRHIWEADGFIVRCPRCETTLGVGVSDTGIRFGPDGRQTNDLAFRACAFASLVASLLNQNAALVLELSDLRKFALKEDIGSKLAAAFTPDREVPDDA